MTIKVSLGIGLLVSISEIVLVGQVNFTLPFAALGSLNPLVIRKMQGFFFSWLCLNEPGQIQADANASERGRRR